jgi:hypothetical protein
MGLETQNILAGKLGYMQKYKDLIEKVNKVFSLLNGLITKLKNQAI